jgi:glucokinase
LSPKNRTEYLQKKSHYRLDKRLYIGLDIGKTKVSSAIVTENGEILLKAQLPTELEKGGPAIIDQSRELIKRMLLHCSRRPNGLGIGSSGVVDSEEGVLISSGSIPMWHNIRIKRSFESEFKLPVAVDNDVNVAALGEHFFGAGQGVNTSVFVTISTGVGFCTIKEGKIWRGTHSLAGQVGYLPIFRRGKTVNYMFSGKGIAERATQALQRQTSTAEAFKLASIGNIEARKIIDEATESAALTIAWIQNTIDPDLFIVGGGVALNEATFLKTIRLKAEQFLQKYMKQLPSGINVSPAKLGVEAGLIGSVALFQH